MLQRSVDIVTPDGMCPGLLSTPAGEGPRPAVIMFPDAGGMRQTFRHMARRLSDLGYVVLVPDLYYRIAPYEPLDIGPARSSTELMEEIMRRAGSYSMDMAALDAAACLHYLDTLGEKAPGGVGTTGYCMGGRLALAAAADLGERVAAAASFHGGNLAKADDPASPHHRARAIRASVYVAAAVEDPVFPDEQKTLLAQSLSEAGVRHTIETYQAHHGFAVPDNETYDPAAAERHWKATEQLFGSVLGG